MSQELGRIERLKVEDFGQGRKLLFVPLVFGPSEGELYEKVQKYWEQVRANVGSLEAKLGGISRLYHELVPAGGEDGLRRLGELSKDIHDLAQALIERGAEFEALEDNVILAEFMDWSRCLAIGLQSPAAISKVYELYNDAFKRRNEHMRDQIDRTLGSGEVGLLLMREGHQVQFPSDIQVFYVAPPVLDEIKRWAREQQARLDEETETDEGETGQLEEDD